MEPVKELAAMDGIDISKQSLLHVKLALSGILYPMLDNFAKGSVILQSIIPYLKEIVNKAIDAELAKHP